MMIRITSLLALSFSLISCGEPEVTSELLTPSFVDVSTEEAAEMLKSDPEMVVLDVRSPEEFSAGHLGDAKNIDFNGAEFEKKIGELDRGKPYLVHCQGGGRSGRSLEVFRKLGFQNIYHLHEGFGTWSESGLPVTK